MLHRKLRQPRNFQDAVETRFSHHERVLGIQVPPSRQFEGTVLMHDLPVGKVAAFVGRDIAGSGIAVEIQREAFVRRQPGQHREKDGIAIFRHDDIRIAAMQVAVQRGNDLCGTFVLQGIGMSVVCHLELIGTPVLRRDNIGTILQRHRRQRRDAVVHVIRAFLQVPAGDPPVRPDSVLAVGQREEACMIEVELLRHDVGIEEHEIRKMFRQPPHHPLHMHGIVDRHPEDIPFLIAVDLPLEGLFHVNAERERAQDGGNAFLLCFRHMEKERRCEWIVAAILPPFAIHQPERHPPLGGVEVKQPPGDRCRRCHELLPAASAVVASRGASGAAPEACTWQCSRREWAVRHRRFRPVAAAQRGRDHPTLPDLPCAVPGGISPSSPFPAG